MRCLKCGHENHDNVNFCGGCGEKVTSEENCPKCHGVNKPEAKFCNKCGQSLFLACPNCQKELRAGGSFCEWCGVNLSQAAKPASTGVEATSTTPSVSLPEGTSAAPRIPAGFTWLREANHTCGGVGNNMHEYRHDQTGIELVYIPGGTFTVGSNKGYDDEKPMHKVNLSPYLIAKYQVTQAQWRKIMGNSPSKFKGDDLPVEQVSWDDCQKFCQKTGLQLPTEGQWEYACRSGNTGGFCFGDDDGKLVEYAWYDRNSVNTTHPVGQKKNNAFGLYDVHGNVWEWCQDWKSKYTEAEVSNPAGPISGTFRVYRGGGWSDVSSRCRAASRGINVPDHHNCCLGFRPVFCLS